MSTYVLRFEIVYVKYQDHEIDVDQDIRDVVAADEESAVKALREEMEYASAYEARSINHIEVIGALEDETF